MLYTCRSSLLGFAYEKVDTNPRVRSEVTNIITAVMKVMTNISSLKTLLDLFVLLKVINLYLVADIIEGMLVEMLTKMKLK